MTPTLMKYPAHERALLLSRLADRYLPTPGIDPLPEGTPEDVALQEKILEEIKAHLALTSDEGPEAQKAILESLSAGMSDAALENANLRAIEERLEQRGALPISRQRQRAEASSVPPQRAAVRGVSKGTARSTRRVIRIVVKADDEVEIVLAGDEENDEHDPTLMTGSEENDEKENEDRQSFPQ